MDTTSPQVMVYGASGHTGRFIVDELRRRGVTINPNEGAKPP